MPTDQDIRHRPGYGSVARRDNWLQRQLCAAALTRVQGQAAIARHKGALLNTTTPRILDLSSQSGFFAHALHRAFPHAHVLQETDDRPFDIVVCGFGLSSMSPQMLARRVSGPLRPGGVFVALDWRSTASAQDPVACARAEGLFASARTHFGLAKSLAGFKSLAEEPGSA